MIRRHLQFRETIATILAEEEAHIGAAWDGMISARQEVERQIAGDPYFIRAFEPYYPRTDSPTVARMIRAGGEAGVGPMAAVAGTIAWAGVEAAASAGAAYCVVDNGGDIALISDREVIIGVHAGGSAVSNRLAFTLPPQAEVLGICTSSATVGPSISLGTADAVTVFSRDVSCADAWATSICNRITPYDDGAFDGLDGSCVCGVMAIMGDVVAAWGRLPPVRGAQVDEGLITAGDEFSQDFHR